LMATAFLIGKEPEVQGICDCVWVPARQRGARASLLDLDMEDSAAVANEEMSAQQRGQGRERRIQLRDTGTGTNYASFFSISAGQDAILFNFGNQLGQPDVVQLEAKIVLEIDIMPPVQQARANGDETGQP